MKLAQWYHIPRKEEDVIPLGNGPECLANVTYSYCQLKERFGTNLDHIILGYVPKSKQLLKKMSMFIKSNKSSHNISTLHTCIIITIKISVIVLVLFP